MLAEKKLSVTEDAQAPEIWKTIKDFQGYKISNKGRLLNKKNIITIGWDGNKGYRIIRLCSNGIRKMKKMHRLVAEAFIHNPHNYPQINHKDCNKQNNQIENLEWCTQSQNVKHAYDSGLINMPDNRGEKCGTAKLNEMQVRVIKRLRGDMKHHEIAALFPNCSRYMVLLILKGKTWGHII